jgi:hypothetical protein
MYSSVRGCYSNGSGAFSIDEGASCNAFKRIFQGNYVTNFASVPIQYHHLGKITLMDNYFMNEKKAVSPMVEYSSWCPGNYDVLSLQNQYASASPFNFGKDHPSKLHSISDRRPGSPQLKAPAVKALQPFPPLVKRKVFEVPGNANTQQVQEIINKAAALKGERAIVHFPMGVVNIDKTLDIPAGSDIQLIGDGLLYASKIRKAGNTGRGGYLMQINGPSYITIKDLQLELDNVDDNILLFKALDQPASQVRLDQLHSTSVTTLITDRYDYTYFEKNNSFFSKGHKLTGGDKVKAGTGTSRLYCFGGQGAGVQLENNATMVAKDCWWEGEYRKNFIPLNLSGYGNLTIDGAMYAPMDNDSGTVVQVSKFKGNVSLMNMYMSGSIDVKPDAPGLNMLAWNINHYHKKDPRAFLRSRPSSRIAMLGISTQCFEMHNIKCTTGNPQSIPDISVNVPDLNKFISQLTTDTRKAMPGAFVTLPAGISNIYISRVSTTNGKTAYTFQK